MPNAGLAALFAGMSGAPALGENISRVKDEEEKKARQDAARKVLAAALASAPKLGTRIMPDNLKDADAGTRGLALVKAMFPDAGGGAGPASLSSPSSGEASPPPSAPPGTEIEQTQPEPLGPGQNPFAAAMGGSEPPYVPQGASPPQPTDGNPAAAVPGSDQDLMGKILKLTGQGPDLSAALGRPVNHRDISDFLQSQIKTPEDFALLSPIAEGYEKVAAAREKGDLDKAQILSSQLSREMQAFIKGMQETQKNNRQEKDLSFKGDQGELNRGAAMDRVKLIQTSLDSRAKRFAKDSEITSMTPDELAELLTQEVRDQNDYGSAIAGLDQYSQAGRIDRGAYQRRITDSQNRVAKIKRALIANGAHVPDVGGGADAPGTEKTTSGGKYSFTK